jgi:Putative phage metallopeptidase
MSRPAKPRTVSYELIARDDDVLGHPMYKMLDSLVSAHHHDLRDARIALAWCTSWKPDVDGRVTLGKCRKASDLDRELAAFDFVILLRRAFWRADQVTDAQRRALLDHELCHGARQFDSAGEPVEDERGRPVYRMRKHDIEEFTEIVERHGCYKADLERFAAALRAAGVPAFQPCEKCAETPGWVYVEDLTGTRRVQRCSCFVAYADQRAEQSA